MKHYIPAFFHICICHKRSRSTKGHHFNTFGCTKVLAARCQVKSLSLNLFWKRKFLKFFGLGLPSPKAIVVIPKINSCQNHLRKKTSKSAKYHLPLCYKKRFFKVRVQVSASFSFFIFFLFKRFFFIIIIIKMRIQH